MIAIVFGTRLGKAAILLALLALALVAEGLLS